jgi:hypothetical protein
MIFWCRCRVREAMKEAQTRGDGRVREEYTFAKYILERALGEYPYL